MIGRQAGDGAVDLLAVQRDEELLDLLGARADPPGDDELATLLCAWRAEIDHGLEAMLPDRTARPPVSPGASGAPAADDAAGGRTHGRRLTAAGTVVAVVLGGSLSLSGVAAAVTGDPLAPYRAVGNALSFGGDDLPDHAAQVAHLNKRLSRARAALAHGDVAGVQKLVDDLTARLATADLTDEQRAALEHRLDALRAAVARASAAGTEKDRSEGRGPGAAARLPGKDAGHEPERGNADEGTAHERTEGDGESATSRDDDAQTRAPAPKRERPAKPAAGTGDATSGDATSDDTTTDNTTTDNTDGGADSTTDNTDGTTDGGGSDSAGDGAADGGDQQRSPDRTQATTSAADAITGPARGKGSVARR